MNAQENPAVPVALRWVDNHCHLGSDLQAAAAAVSVASEAGVRVLIDVGCDVATSQAAIANAQTHDGVFATVGLHPHEARHGLDGIEELLSQGGVVAVGECGLDYHYDHSPRAQQRSMFAAQIELAHRHELPLVIHTREAWDETFEILDREGVPASTIFHCFSGGPSEARESLERGGYLSFSGIVSFGSAGEVRDAARDCPADRLLVETDSPYLAPTPFRGKPNEPRLVARVGEVLSEVRDESLLDTAALTWANAHRAYPGLGAD